jgi:hypothetical protein
VSFKDEWADALAKKIMGMKVTEVRYMTEDEKEHLGWDRCSIVIVLNDELVIFPAMDDEGNGPGALFTTIKTLSCIPIL